MMIRRIFLNTALVGFLIISLLYPSAFAGKPLDEPEFEPLPAPATAPKAASPSPGNQPSPVTGKASSAGAPFQVTLSESHYLPPEMYGEWSVNATLIETNDPAFFPPSAHDIWILGESNGQVNISNPATGASASINVDEVKGKTATFHRMIVRNGQVFYEIPTITVDGDRLYGTTLHRYELVHNNQVTRRIYAKFQLSAIRLGGARIRFGDAPPAGQTPKFDIQDIKPAPANGSPPPPPDRSNRFLYVH